MLQCYGSSAAEIIITWELWEEEEEDCQFSLQSKYSDREGAI